MQGSQSSLQALIVFKGGTNHLLMTFLHISGRESQDFHLKVIVAKLKSNFFLKFLEMRKLHL